MTETAHAFPCLGNDLIGILHTPEAPRSRGILFVVGGGPQYRVGGARQLTLWARDLAANGYPVFRFDYRGMGDAQGEFAGFEHADADIQAAVDLFFKLMPNLVEVVLWGECDASSAILFYAHRDPRVRGMVLLNPWVRTQEGEAKVILKFYYLRRIMQRSFWRKVLALRFNPFASVLSAVKLWSKSRTTTSGGGSAATGKNGGDYVNGQNQVLPARLLTGLTRFRGPVLLVLSGRDLIAREFAELVDHSPVWQAQFRAKPVTRHDLPHSDHTFSSASQRQQVVDLGSQWLGSW